jgi:hypothetical protein
MRRIADSGRLEKAWRDDSSGLFLRKVLHLVAESQKADRKIV